MITAGLAPSSQFSRQTQVEEHVAALAQVESAAGLRTGRDGSASRFCRLDRWFLGERLVAAELRRRFTDRRNLERLPRLSSQSTWALLQTRFMTHPVTWPVAADAVLFHSNLRGFYISTERATLKLLGSLRSAEEFRRDVEMRHAILESGVLDVPRVLGGDLRASRPYVMDELIFGQRAKPAKHRQLLRDELTPRIWRMYQTFDITTERCSAHFDLDVVSEKLAELPLAPEWQEEQDCRAAIIDHLSTLRAFQDKLILTSLGHGDLSVGNLIVSPAGRVCVLDWELARRMPIAWDFRKLLLRIPALTHRVLALFEAEIAAGKWQDILAPQHQCLIALAAHLADWRSEPPSAAEMPLGPRSPEHRLAQMRRDLRNAGQILGNGAFRSP